MFTIQADYSLDWYSLFYLASSILTYVFLIFLGLRKGYPLSSWVLILATGSLFFIVGTKLLAFGSGEWTSLLREGSFPEHSGKSAIGGLLFAILGVELSRSWLRIKEFVLDTYVLIVPLGLAIQKPGCLMAGCCYGKPTALPWGVFYAKGTPAHYHQWITGSIPSSQLFSTSVHPLPLYEMVSYLLIFGALILLAPYLQKKGSRFLLALTLLAFSRFTLEFIRDSTASVALGNMIGGLKTMQWAMLATGLVSGILLIRNLLHRANLPNKTEWRPPPLWRKFTMILFLSLLMWTVHTGFSSTEMLVMNFKLLPALILFGIHAWIRLTAPGFRYAGIILLLLPLFLMGQSVPGSDREWNVFHSFGVGGNVGHYYQEARYNEHEGSCGPTYSYNYYDQHYGAVSLNYQYTMQSGYLSKTYGGSFFAGNNTEYEVGAPGFNRHFFAGIHPYMDFNSRWVGVAAGVSLGYLKYFPTGPFDEKRITSGMRTFPLLPSGKIRVGPYDIVDLEYQFLDEFPSELPFLTHQISLGTGLGFKNGSGIRFGLAPPEESYFFSANALIHEKLMFQAKYIYTHSSGSYSGSGSFFSLGLNYRLSSPNVPTVKKP
jgi:prolipoprotein diacylglyceryltransferase